MKQIIGKIKNYDWGCDGMNSSVAKYALLGNHIQKIDTTIPYAELWLGTPKDNVTTYYDDKTELTEELPYLFKFLSINKPLSIQIHPNKKLAEELHIKKPDIYPDSNHKPEVAIALTQLEALSGLKTIEDIKDELKNYPEIQLSENSFESHNKLVSEFIKISRGTIILLLNRLSIKQRLNNKLTQTDKLILAINKYFLNDVGVLSPIYMTYVKLKKFEALFIKPATPHVYLKGNILECMATSDNVVRLALTSKIKDQETLSMIDLQAETTLIEPKYDNIHDRLTYDMGLDEFMIDIIRVTTPREVVVTKNTMLVILSGFGLIDNTCYIKGTSLICTQAVETIKLYSPDMHIAIIKPGETIKWCN